MPIDKLFGGSLALAARALDVLSTRQGLIQSNIANLETPGYKAKDIPFAEVMKQAMTGGGELARTNSKHLPVSQDQGLTSGKTLQSNGPVNLDEEMLKLSETQLFYQIGTRIITKKFEDLKFVIDEGGK